jgi:hypothetical protein
LAKYVNHEGIFGGSKKPSYQAMIHYRACALSFRLHRDLSCGRNGATSGARPSNEIASCRMIKRKDMTPLFWVGMGILWTSFVVVFVEFFRMSSRLTRGMQALTKEVRQDAAPPAMEHAQPVTVKILRLSESGMTINDNPVVAYHLAVIPTIGVPYRVEITQRTSLLSLPRVQPGTFVPALVLPDHPTAISLILDREPTAEEHAAMRTAEERQLPYDQLPLVASPPQAIDTSISRHMGRGTSLSFLMKLAIFGIVIGGALLAIDAVMRAPT